MVSTRFSTFVTASLVYSAILAAAGPVPQSDVVADHPNKFENVTTMNGGVIEGPGKFEVTNNGAYSGNTNTNEERRELGTGTGTGSGDYYNYGGNAGTANGAYDTFNYGGDSYNNIFEDVDTVNGGFAQGSGDFSTGNNGAGSGNTNQKRKPDTYNYGGNAGTANGAYDTFNYGGDVYTNEFEDVGTVNGGFAQGSGEFDTGSNGAQSGNSNTRRDGLMYNYGGNAGSANGAYDTFNDGDVITNKFQDVDTVNSGFVQGSGTFETANNGAGSGNTNSNTRRQTYTFGGTDGTANGAGDSFMNGDNISDSFEDVDTINGGFAQGSGMFGIENNGANSGNDLGDDTMTRRGAGRYAVKNVNGGFVQGSGDFETTNNGAFSGNASKRAADPEDCDEDAPVTTSQGETFTNSFNGVQNVNGGFVQGSGNFRTGNNGAYSGNSKRDDEDCEDDVPATPVAPVHAANGDTFSNNFDRVKNVNGGFVQGSGNFETTNNGASSGNAKRDEDCEDDIPVQSNGDSFSNNFDRVQNVNGGFVQGSGNFRTGNNGAFSGNTKRDEEDCEDDVPATNPSASTFNNNFNRVKNVNGGFVQGSGNFETTNNGAYSGNTRRDGLMYNYGGNAGTANGAYDTFNEGDSITNSFENVGEVNGGFVQGSGNFETGNNGANSGNTLVGRQASYINNFGQTGVGLDQDNRQVEGDVFENSFEDVDNLNGGFVQGSGNFETESNGAYSGNTDRVD